MWIQNHENMSFNLDHFSAYEVDHFSAHEENHYCLRLSTHDRDANLVSSEVFFSGSEAVCNTVMSIINNALEGGRVTFLSWFAIQGHAAMIGVDICV
jgi:hypothetical protein